MPCFSHRKPSGGFWQSLRTFAGVLEEYRVPGYYAPFDVHLHKPGVKNPDVVQPDLIVACDLEN